MEISVRRATIDDVDRLARINIDSWRAAYAGIVPPARLDEMDLATYRQRWLDTVTTGRPGVALLVAEIDGVLASYARGGPYRPQEDATAEASDQLGELYAFYADPPMQGRGAGTAAQDAMLGWLEEEGYTEVALWVLVANHRSRTWYAKRGWLADGATSSWIAHGHRLPELRLRRGLPSKV